MGQVSLLEEQFLWKDMNDSLADEKNVVEIDLYKLAFEIRVRG